SRQGRGELRALRSRSARTRGTWWRARTSGCPLLHDRGAKPARRGRGVRRVRVRGGRAGDGIRAGARHGLDVRRRSRRQLDRIVRHAVSHPTTPQAAPTCYRHPDRATYVRCTRCNRPICPECMRDAAVGHQCEECVREGAKTVRQPRTVFGGRKKKATPVVTYALIAINVVMFVLDTVSPTMQSELVLRSPAVADGDLYRLLTSAFMHYGITHLLFNMY